MLILFFTNGTLFSLWQNISSWDYISLSTSLEGRSSQYILHITYGLGLQGRLFKGA